MGFQRVINRSCELLDDSETYFGECDSISRHGDMTRGVGNQLFLFVREVLLDASFNSSIVSRGLLFCVSG
jgi:hypothetical protein